MPKILAFDTCLDKMYVALFDGERILESKIIETTQTTYHSAFLISTISEILINAGFEANDIDMLATNIGPGSFTGIRACMTVSRVMAQGLDKKAIGVSSLELISSLNDSDKKTLVALDARKEMAYIGIYQGEEEILSPRAIPVEEVKSILKSDDYYLITDDKLQEILGGHSYQKSGYDFGKALCCIASRKLKQGVDTDWRKLLPLYIQPPALHVKKTCEK